MSLIDTLSTIIENNLFEVDALSSEALVSYEETLVKRIAEKNKDTANNKGSFLAELRQLRALLPFFKYLKSHPEKVQSLYVWLLDWQLSLHHEKSTPQPKHLLSVELDYLMRHFLECNKDAAMAYYHAYQETLEKASPLLKHRMQSLFNEEEKLNQKLTETFEALWNDCVKEERKPTKPNPLDDWKHYFNKALQGQADEPAAILPLAIHYYDEPEAFAAILLWMLVHGVTPQVILHSGLLHKLFEGHVAYIADPDNEMSVVALVYQHLKASGNPGALALIGLAEKTSAYIPGDGGREALRGCDGYNLIGQAQEKEQAANLTVLSIEQIIRPAANISPDFENITALSASFGNRFLRLLASVPAVASAFTEEQWQAYLAEAMQGMGDEVTSFPDWFNLYALIKTHQPSLKGGVFLKIIDLAFMHQQQINGDRAVFLKLKGLFDIVTKQIFIARANALVDSLNAFIVEKAQSLTLEGYQAIEAAWREKVQYFNYVCSLCCFDNFPLYPKTIYKFQAEVLRCGELKSSNVNFFVITGLIVSHAHLDRKTKLSYQKELLLAWVVRERNKEAQSFIIDRLSKKFKVSVNWSSQLQSKRLFHLSAAAGNLALLEYFFQGEWSYFQQTDEMYLGLVGAARGGWLDVVKFLMAYEWGYHRDNAAKGDAFIEAVRYGRTAVVEYFIGYKDFLSLHRGHLYQGLQLAIEYHHKDMIDLLLKQLRSDQANKMNCGYKEVALAEVNGMAGVLRVAVEVGAYDVVVSLCGSEADLLPNEEAVFQALRYVIAGRHIAILTYLCELEGKKALSAEHMVCLLSHAILADSLAALDVILKLKTSNAPDRDAIFQALDHAIKLNNLHAFELILRVCGEKLFEVKIMRDIINNTVDDLLFSLFRKGKWDFMLCFRRLNEVRAPSPRCIERIIQGSAEQKRFDVALCLFKRWHKNMLPGERDALFVRLCDDVKDVNHPGVVAALHDCFLLMLTSVPSEKISQAIVAYFVFLLKNKSAAEKYHALVDFYKANMGVMGVEKAVAIFNFIDSNAGVLGISTQPVKQTWEPGFIKRNGVHPWPVAWGVIRHLIFKAWRDELRSDQTTPTRQQALIALFEGCSEPDGPHYKLMGMKRASNKRGSKTSRRIEEEIAKVKDKPVPRFG